MTIETNSRMPTQFRMYVAVLLACISVFTSTGMVSAYVDSNSTANLCVTSRNGLNMRTGPGTNYWRKTALPFGTKVSRISTHGYWTQTRYGKVTGWMHSNYLGPCRTTHRCDSNYSGYCVPIVNYDLDCKDVGDDFRVVGYDRHRFDRDKDGWACES